MTTSTQWHLVRRPHGEPVDADFSLVEAELGEPGEGQVLVRNTLLSVDPYMRGRMNDAKSYVPPFAARQADGRLRRGRGRAVGAGAPTPPDAPEGRRHRDPRARLAQRAVVPADRTRLVDTAWLAPQAYLGVLGMPGSPHTPGCSHRRDPGGRRGLRLRRGGRGGLPRRARSPGSRAPRRSSAAPAGPTRRGGCSTRSASTRPSTTRRHHRRAAPQAAPEGIDVYFDNVGGDHLEAAIGALRPYGRAALCGAISPYNDTAPPRARAT